MSLQLSSECFVFQESLECGQWPGPFLSDEINLFM